jgi:hypothetical protein
MAVAGYLLARLVLRYEDRPRVAAGEPGVPHLSAT